jgi:hypothetical protein
MILSKLTPAETLLIKDGSQASVKELLKYTLMDLLLKQVLMIENVERHQPNMRDAARTYKYVSIGKNFNGYAALPHELAFLSTFQRNCDTRMLFRNCVQVGYQNAGSKTRLHRLIITSPELFEAFSASWLEKIFGLYNYTSHGLQLQKQVELELSGIAQVLRDSDANERKVVVESLKSIGGNLFLLQVVDFALLREIDEELSKQLAYHDNTGGGCSSTWICFDTCNDDFDNSCSSDSGDSSGCSSGDSGCGGGCGGCGGD